MEIKVPIIVDINNNKKPNQEFKKNEKEQDGKIFKEILEREMAKQK